MRKLVFLAVFGLATSSFAQQNEQLCNEGDNSCCSAAFQDAHTGLVNAGWESSAAYDFLLPSYYTCMGW